MSVTRRRDAFPLESFLWRELEKGFILNILRLPSESNDFFSLIPHQKTGQQHIAQITSCLSQAPLLLSVTHSNDFTNTSALFCGLLSNSTKNPCLWVYRDFCLLADPNVVGARMVDRSILILKALDLDTYESLLFWQN